MSTTSASRASGAKPRRRFRGLSPEERKEQRRARFVQAGLATFGVRGFHTVGVRDVCAEAELTERYFYESFENREALFSAVYDAAQARLLAAFERAIQGAGAEPSLVARAALRAVLETLRDDPPLARVLLIDVLTVGFDVGRQSVLATQGFVDIVEAAFEALHPRRDRKASPPAASKELRSRGLPARRMVGSLHRKPALDPRWIASGLVGSTVHIVMQWALNGFKEPIDRILEHCVVFYDAIESQVQGLETSGAARPSTS